MTADWIIGPPRSGKTTLLLQRLTAWLQACPTPAPGALAFASIGDTRLELADRLAAQIRDRHPCATTTPLGFFENEVQLFWPLLLQTLDLRAQFPLRLASETESELAAQLWAAEIDRVIANQSARQGARAVRRMLDIYQLASLAGKAIADIPEMLSAGFAGQMLELPLPPNTIGQLLQRWQTWCLERGLLTYGLIAQLYAQVLLPLPEYQSRLRLRYGWVLVDDLDEFPAIACDLFHTLLDLDCRMAFTYNPEGGVRLGLGADPAYAAGLAPRCDQTLTLPLSSPPSAVRPTLLPTHGTSVTALVEDPLSFASLDPDHFQVLQTYSRSELLRATADRIIATIQAGQAQPHEIAVVGPGWDAIARYSLIEILTKQNIPVEFLNDQRPLNSTPMVRALLTLLTLVYPNLGRLVDRNAVAEMLVVLTQRLPAGAEASPEVEPFTWSAASPVPPPTRPPHPDTNPTDPPTAEPIAGPKRFWLPLIDPVRAGLLADHCFVPHPETPRLLPATTFPRWDRLGYQGSEAYSDLVNWIAVQQEQLRQRLIPNGVALLDRAVQHFLLGGSVLSFDQLAVLRQLLETAQHYWQVSDRLRQYERQTDPTIMASSTLRGFIQLLRSGAITANPYPVRSLTRPRNAVTLATLFQYCTSRRSHRWQFWLDAGSPFWLTGGNTLFAAPLFLQDWDGGAWTPDQDLAAKEERLRRILLDLLGRVEEQVVLCHSELATNGQEQNGPLLSLISAATLFQPSLLKLG